MGGELPFFNWSLKKATDSQSESFIKARIRLIFTILIFSLLKALVALVTAIASEQWLQVNRAAIALLFYTALIKILLYKPAKLRPLAHIMILAGILMVFSSIIFFSHDINLVILQFVFMIVLSGFYTLGGKWGFIYASISILPVVSVLLLGDDVHIFSHGSAQKLASPGYEILAILNFISIVVAHYLFYKAFSVNIQEKEKLNLQLQQSATEANKLAESRANFLSTMSHELRTPLNSVLGITELLMRDNPEKRQQENLKILQLSTSDLLSLINNVLDFNKTESDKVILESVPFQLAELIENKCTVLQIKAQDKQLRFILDIDEGLRHTVVASDPTRLSQIMYNLVSNAVKFTEQGSVTVKLELKEKAEKNVQVLFSVTDTGIGIHPDRHESVFDMFTQAESHITRKYGGTGLGLAIVNQLVSLFNSSIQLNSTPGKGTSFSFLINFATAPSLAKPAAASPQERIDLSHLKILVAEDNDVNRLLIRKQMDTLQLQPAIVENGALAFDALMAHDYDAIFMDLHMPVSDGYQTTKQIRGLADAAKAGVHIVAFTASVTEQEKIFENGFDDFLYKPVNINDLYDKLEKIARRHNTMV